MPQVRMFMRLAAFLALCLAASACDQSEQAKAPEWQIYIDPDLASVNGQLAIYEAKAKLGRRNYCEVSKAFSDFAKSDLLEGSKAILQDLGLEYRGLCLVYRAATNASSAISSQTKAANRVPSPLYTFILVSEEDGAYVEDVVGVFGAPADCIAIQLLASRAGLATKICRPWKPF